MSRKKISTTIYVTPEQNERLKLLHARSKVPTAVFIREGIDMVLARYAHLLPGQLQLTDSPEPPHALGGPPGGFGGGHPGPTAERATGSSTSPSAKEPPATADRKY